ncbi:MAG: WG repeat-containing protein [Spirochaetales bacterium]|nr:WG repeat-containing protein [Spirochaetales bacterium]
MKKIFSILAAMAILSCTSNFFARETPELFPFRKGDKWGYCNSKKEIIIPLKYDFTKPFHDGFAWVVLNNKLGIVDTSGRIKQAFISLSCWSCFNLPFIKDTGSNG